MKTIKWILVIAAISGLLGSAAIINKLTIENARMTNNQETLLDAKNTAQNEARQLNLTVHEMEEVIESDEQLKTVLYDSLDLKAKEIKHLAKLYSEMNLHVEAELIDTIIYVSDTVYMAKKFEWSNDWFDVDGLISLMPPPANDLIEFDVAGRDSIFYTSNLIKYKKFFVSRWFEKPTPVTKIWNVNPHVKITVQQVINQSK